MSNSQHLAANIASCKYMRPDKFLARPGRKQATAQNFLSSYIIFIVIIGGILVLFIDI